MSHEICKETGEKIRGDCTQFEDRGYNACDRYEDHGYSSCDRWESECCHWWPCSWFCRLITWFCTAWVWITNIICVSFVWISNLICVAYSYIAVVTCYIVMEVVTIIMAIIEKIIVVLLAIARMVGSLFSNECLPIYSDEDKFKISLTSPLKIFDGKADMSAETVQMPKGLHLMYLGTNSIYISDNETNLLIDPYFSRPDVNTAKMMFCPYIEITPKQKIISEVLMGANISKVNAVLITHSHYDHALDIAKVINYLKSLPNGISPMLYGSKSTYYVGKGGGISDDQITVIKESQTYKVGGFEVQFILSKHLEVPVVGQWLMGTITGPITPPANLFDYKDGGTYAIYIKHKLGTILNVGSANYKDNAFDFLKDNVDNLILGIAGFDQDGVVAFDHPTYRHDFYKATVGATNPKKIYFSHYDDFNQPLNNVTSCYHEPSKTYDFFIDENKNLKPLFLPIGGYVQL